MCGIVGQLAFGELDEKMEKTRQESMIFFGSELLQMTQEKGKDATGVSLLLENGNYIGLKMGIPSIDFISRYGKTEKEYGGFVKIWRKSSKPGKVFLGHCRAVTKGSPLDNDNNHPIKVGDVIGIHNGTIQNDDDVFKKLGCERTGSVDSEAVFRLLHHYTKNGTEPFTNSMLEEVVQRLAGTFAVMAYSGNNPYQVCAFRDRKPIEMVLIKPLKLVVCATEKKFIETSIYRYNKYINLYMPGSKFPTLKKGDIEFKALIDDSAVIFDLRTEITKNTGIQDLYDWEKMPRTRIWGYGTGNNYHQLPVHTKSSKPNPLATRTGAPAGKELAAPSKGATENKDDRPPGRIWIKAINGYASEDSEEVKQTKGIGNIEINVDTGNVDQLSPPKEEDGKFALEDKGKAIEDHPKTELSTKIKELNTKTKEPKAEEKSIKKINSSMKTVEVDAFVDAEAIEVAEEAAKTVQQYENDEEVLTDLEVQNLATLKKIPLASLVNRIQRFMYKKGVYNGYTLCKATKNANTDQVELVNKKKESAEKNVRVLKTVTKMLLRVIKFSGTVKSVTLINAVRAAFENNEEVSRESMDKLFTAGDERNYELIKKMKSVVSEKEKR